MAKIIKKEEVNIVWTDDPDLSLNKSNKKNTKEINPTDYQLSIRRETKSRGGKTVTVVFIPFEDNPKYFKKLAKSLKKSCGTGGTTKKDSIEIQGDFVDHIIEYLNKLNFKTKVVGG